MPNLVKERKAPGAFLLSHRERVRPESIVIADEELVSTICWCYKRNDVFFLELGGEFSYGLRYDDKKHRLLTINELRELIQPDLRKAPVTLITKTTSCQKYRSMIPQTAFVDIYGRFMFVQF